MILMYVYLDNSSNLEGNYLMMFLLILVIILFMGMIGAGFVLNIVNIIRLIKVLIKEGKIAETKKVYITLLFINIVSFIGCVRMSVLQVCDRIELFSLDSCFLNYN